MRDHVTPRRVVILGGGFAGLFAARAIRKSPVAVTAADRRAHHDLQPLPDRCACGIPSDGQIAPPLRGVPRRLHHVRCVLADATDVDAGARLVHARRREGGAVAPSYDDVIVAVGMRPPCCIGAHGPTVQDRDGRTSRFDARTVRWATGVEVPPVAAAPAGATGAEQDRAGRIVVDADLTVPGHPEIRVTGHLMSLKKLPGPGQVAMPSGAWAGRSVRHAVEGRTKKPNPFQHVDFGSAASIARGRAVVKAGPLHLPGFTGPRGSSSVSAAGRERCSAGPSPSPPTRAANGSSPGPAPA
jgi:NADH dehydrogenase FAD-containing subunit